MSDNFFHKPFKTVRFRGNKLPINVWDHLSEDKGFAMTVVRESDGLRHIYFPPPRRYFKSDEARADFISRASDFQSWSRMRVVKVVQGRFPIFEWADRYESGGVSYSREFDRDKETWGVVYDLWSKGESYRGCDLFNEEPYLGLEVA